MGISMGAIATLDMVYRFPDTFAKAISICGATNIERMREFKGKTLFRFYHGDIDDVIPVTYSREAYKALKTTGKKAEDDSGITLKIVTNSKPYKYAGTIAES